jgi:hypothetical protein
MGLKRHWRAIATTIAVVGVVGMGTTDRLASALPGGAAQSPHTAPLDPQGEDWEGLAQLVRMATSELGPARVVATQRLALGTLSREDALLIVHPTRPLEVDELAAFMRAGGRVALFDDYGTGDALAAHFGIRRVPLPEHPLEMLRDNPSFAIAEPTGAHPAVHDVSRVVTNHGTGLVHPGLSPLLVVRGDGEPDVLLGVAGAVGQGRLLVVGDASIAMNAMLRYPGNRELALGSLRYLVEDDAWGKRGGKLYVLTNVFETTGTYGNDSPLGGAALAAQRSLVESFESVRRDGMSPGAAYAAAIALGLLVVAWTARRVGRTHRPVVARFARPTPLTEQGGIAGHAAEAGAPGASRLLAIRELKSALEEDLATRLGLPRAPAPESLAAKAHGAGLLGAEDAEDLGRLLAVLAKIEGAATGAHRRSPAERMPQAEIAALAERARRLLARAAAAPPRDTVGASQ